MFIGFQNMLLSRLKLKNLSDYDKRYVISSLIKVQQLFDKSDTVVCLRKFIRVQKALKQKKIW